MELLVMLAMGFILGFAIATIFNRRDALGVLKVVNVEEEEPYLFLELDDNINRVCDELKVKEYVIFRVEHEGDPQV